MEENICSICEERISARRKCMYDSSCITNKALKCGMIKRGPCVVCGEAENTVLHHPNYNQPLRVVSLCRRCHSRLHGRFVGAMKRVECPHCGNVFRDAPLNFDVLCPFMGRIIE